jgi:hypothetical protein
MSVEPRKEHERGNHDEAAAEAEHGPEKSRE